MFSTFPHTLPRPGRNSAPFCQGPSQQQLQISPLNHHFPRLAVSIIVFTPREPGWRTGKVGQQINELISCGPAAPGWKQLDLLLLQSSIHSRKTENPHSSSLVGGRQREEGHQGGGGGGRTWFGSNGNQSWLLFSKPSLGSSCWWSLGGKKLGSFRNASGNY